MLGDGASVSASLELPGGTAWRAAIMPAAGETALVFESGVLCLSLSASDTRRLCEADREGVYFESDGLRYFVEKDFPCAHPRAADALEPATETFAPPPDFEARKSS